MQNNIANLEMLRGRHQQAIKVYRRTLRDFEMNPDTRQDTALSYYNLSLAHKHIGQTEEALKAVEQALRLARALNDSHLLAYFTAQRGAVLDDLGEWSRATEDYLNAARLLDTVGDDPGRATIMSHQAALHKRQGAYERAEKLLLNALSIFDKARLPHIHDQALIWLNLGDLYFAMDHLQDAWDYANRALETFERLGSAWKDQAREIVSLIDQALPPEADTQSAENIQGAPSDRDSAPSSGSLFRPEAGQSPPAASPGFDPLDGGEIPPSSLS
jgi:tetratricopeptide (TPR) repeat protein